MIKLGIALAVLVGSIGAGSVSGAYAQSYGCRINPHAAACQKPVKPTKTGPVVTGVSNPAVNVLPTTGGAAPAGSSTEPMLVLAALASLMAGAGTLRLAARKQ